MAVGATSEGSSLNLDDETPVFVISVFACSSP
jgi:hypothetical protein